MKTIQMTIDAKLLKAVDKLTRARKTSRSAFIRQAVAAQLRNEQIRELEAQHIAGYLANPVTKGEFDAWGAEQDWGMR